MGGGGGVGGLRPCSFDNGQKSLNIFSGQQAEMVSIVIINHPATGPVVMRSPVYLPIACCPGSNHNIDSLIQALVLNGVAANECCKIFFLLRAIVTESKQGHVVLHVTVCDLRSCIYIQEHAWAHFCFEKERKKDEEENERGRDRERRLRTANPKSLF